MAEYTVTFATEVEITASVAADEFARAEELARDRAQDALNQAAYKVDAMISGSVVDGPSTVTEVLTSRRRGLTTRAAL